MKVREYLSNFSKYTDVTFIKARARKDANTPFYHTEYQTTPMQSIEDWEKSKIMDYYVLNNKQSPIEWLSGTGWINQFNRGHLISLLVISKEDIETLYSKEQAKNIIEYIDKKIFEEFN